MLLRSTSTPLLKAYTCPLSTPDLDMVTTRPVSLSLDRTSSDGGSKFLSLLKENISPRSPAMSPLAVERTLSVHSDWSVALEDIEEEEKMVSDSESCGGLGGGRNAGDGFLGYGPGPYESESLDLYYQSMIETYPGDALLLANYAKFLKEVKGDNLKAEEICEKAIMKNPKDGNVLCMYGDLIRNKYKDSVRAQTYFDEAVQSSPNDCYVLASYARFLWEEEEEEDGGGGGEKEIQLNNGTTFAQSHRRSLSHGYTHLAVASF